jgi:hypothetical protein
MSLLDKYRKVQEESITVNVQNVEGHPYKAFESATVMQRRIDLRPGHDAQRIVNYGYLIEISHAAGMLVGLMFTNPVLSVRIEGKNLQGMVDLLREEKVIAIQEFIPSWHAQPPAGEPIITKMVVTTKHGSTARPVPPKH